MRFRRSGSTAREELLTAAMIFDVFKVSFNWSFERDAVLVGSSSLAFTVWRASLQAKHFCCQKTTTGHSKCLLLFGVPFTLSDSTPFLSIRCKQVDFLDPFGPDGYVAFACQLTAQTNVEHFSGCCPLWTECCWRNLALFGRVQEVLAMYWNCLKTTLDLRSGCFVIRSF